MTSFTALGYYLFWVGSLLSLVLVYFIISVSLLFRHLLRFSRDNVGRIINSASINRMLLGRSTVASNFLRFYANVFVEPTNATGRAKRFPRIFRLYGVTETRHISNAIRSNDDAFRFVLNCLLLTLYRRLLYLDRCLLRTLMTGQYP